MFQILYLACPDTSYCIINTVLKNKTKACHFLEDSNTTYQNEQTYRTSMLKMVFKNRSRQGSLLLLKASSVSVKRGAYLYEQSVCAGLMCWCSQCPGMNYFTHSQCCSLKALQLMQKLQSMKLPSQETSCQHCVYCFFI